MGKAKNQESQNVASYVQKHNKEKLAMAALSQDSKPIKKTKTVS